MFNLTTRQLRLQDTHDERRNASCYKDCRADKWTRAPGQRTVVYRVLDTTIIWGGCKYDNTARDLRRLHTVPTRRLRQHRKWTWRRTPVTHNSGADIRRRDKSLSRVPRFSVSSCLQLQKPWRSRSI